MNDLLGGKEAGEGDALVDLPKDEAGRPERALENLQSDVSEATASVVGKLSTPITVSEAGQRNARDVRARKTDLTEEATPQETDRRAAPTEAGKVNVLKSKATKRFSAA